MKTTQRPRRIFEPQQKITAVLSIWTERRTSAQVCQELSISPTLLGQWQNLIDIQSRLAEAGGYTCLLGVDQDHSTLLHTAEEILRLRGEVATAGSQRLDIAVSGDLFRFFHFRLLAAAADGRQQAPGDGCFPGQTHSYFREIGAGVE